MINFPSIFVPLMGLVFPTIAMAFYFFMFKTSKILGFFIPQLLFLKRKRGANEYLKKKIKRTTDLLYNRVSKNKQYLFSLYHFFRFIGVIVGCNFQLSRYGSFPFFLKKLVIFHLFHKGPRWLFMELGVSLLVFICGGLFCGILAMVLISSIKKRKKKYVFFVGISWKKSSYYSQNTYERD